jgi:hypothetical protein
LPQGQTFQLKRTTRQRDIKKKLLRTAHLEFSEHPDSRVRALYMAQSDRHATAYKSMPIRRDALMESDEFMVTARRSLGVNIVAEVFECHLCKGLLDKKGDHECPSGGCWSIRHDLLRDLLQNTAREALLPSKIEQPFTLLPECPQCHEIFKTSPDLAKHECPKREGPIRKLPPPTYQADVVLETGVPGITSKKTLLDVTVRNEFLPTYLERASQVLGAAAAVGEKEKIDDWRHRIEALGYSFLAVSCDSMGYLRPQGEEVINYLISQRAITKSLPFYEAAAHFWHKWSVTIHKANARNILSRYKIIANHIEPLKTRM